MTSNVTLLRRSWAVAACFGLGLALLAGCGTSTDNGTDQAVDEVFSEGSVLITDPQLGQAEIGAGAQVPDFWPAAVPLYPAGTLVSAVVNDSSGMNSGIDALGINALGINAMWTEPTPSKEAWNDYFDALMEMGYAETGFVLSDANGDNTSIHSLRGNGWDLTLTFTSSKEEGGIIHMTGLPTTE
jgi:hypothetical protein